MHVALQIHFYKFCATASDRLLTKSCQPTAKITNKLRKWKPDLVFSDKQLTPQQHKMLPRAIRKGKMQFSAGGGEGKIRNKCNFT